MTAATRRETFYRAQARHRRNARLRAIPAVLAAATMGIPLGVYLSPVLLALAIIVSDLVNLVVPTFDLGGEVWTRIDRLLDGDLGAIGSIAWILVIWVIPGIVALVIAYLLVAWRLRRIGGDGIALGIGARAIRPDDAQERQLGDIVTELAVAAGIEPPQVLVYDDGPANAFVFGRDPNHATVVIERGLLDDLDREETQGVIGRLIASAVDGDLGLAIDIAAVYVAYGLLTTSLAAIVSHAARVRLRAAISALLGRHRDQRGGAAGIAALLGLPSDDDIPNNAAAGCLTLLTMGGMISVGISLINLFLSGPLLTFAWRSRGYLADATAVELTRDADGLARALTRMSDRGRDVPGTAWLELLLFVGGGSGGSTPAGSLPRLSDTGLTVSLVPPVSKRLARLMALGASVDLPPGRATTGAGATAIGASAAGLRPAGHGGVPTPGRRAPVPTWLGVLIIAPLLAIAGVLAVVAAALIVYLVAFAAFVVLAVVAGPIHELLRSLAGR